MRVYQKVIILFSFLVEWKGLLYSQIFLHNMMRIIACEELQDLPIYTVRLLIGFTCFLIERVTVERCVYVRVNCMENGAEVSL